MGQRGIKITIGKQPYDKYPAFLSRLNDLYNGKFFKQKFGDPNSYCVKWYMQESTFSYAIYQQKNAFVPGKALYESDVFWHGNDELAGILKDIYKNVKLLQSKR